MFCSDLSLSSNCQWGSNDQFSSRRGVCLIICFLSRRRGLCLIRVIRFSKSSISVLRYNFEFDLDWGLFQCHTVYSQE